MKLELVTNATVVDDAIRFVTSHATPIPPPIEKANSDKIVIVGEENHSHEKQSMATSNSIF